MAEIGGVRLGSCGRYFENSLVVYPFCRVRKILGYSNVNSVSLLLGVGRLYRLEFACVSFLLVSNKNFEFFLWNRCCL